MNVARIAVCAGGLAAAAVLVLSPRAEAAPALTTTTVNLRQGPGTNYPVVNRIPAGSQVEVAGCQGQWCSVTWQGQSGYTIATSLDQGPGPGGPGGPSPDAQNAPPPGAEGAPPPKAPAPGYPQPPLGATAQGPIPTSPLGAPPPGYPPPPPGYSGYYPPPGYYYPPGYYGPYYPYGYYYGPYWRRRYW